MIDNITFGSGGAKCFAFMGAMKALEEKDYIQLNNIHKWGGVSGGSIIAFLYALGMTTEFITNLILHVDLDNLLLDEGGMHGLLSGKRIIKILKIILHETLSISDITFKDLYYRFNSELSIQVTNLSKHQSEIWSYKTHPNESIITTIRMSVAIPFIFAPVDHESSIYIDGGVIESFIRPSNDETTLTLRIYNELPTNSSHTDFLEYMTDILNLLYFQRENSYAHHKNIIFIRIPTQDVVVLTPTAEVKTSLVEDGYQQTLTYLKGLSIIRHAASDNNGRDDDNAGTPKGGTSIHGETA